MKILRGTVFGGIVFFLLGWLVYGILLANFMEAQTDTSLNRPDDQMVWWAMILSNLVLGLLVTLVLKWSNASKFTDGIQTGALFGLLFALSMDLMMYSMTSMITVTALIVDVIVMAILLAIVGLVIVLTWGKDKSPD